MRSLLVLLLSIFVSTAGAAELEPVIPVVRAGEWVGVEIRDLPAGSAVIEGSVGRTQWSHPGGRVLVPVLVPPGVAPPWEIQINGESVEMPIRVLARSERLVLDATPAGVGAGELYPLTGGRGEVLRIEANASPVLHAAADVVVFNAEPPNVLDWLATGAMVVVRRQPAASEEWETTGPSLWVRRATGPHLSATMPQPYEAVSFWRPARPIGERVAIVGVVAVIGLVIVIVMTRPFSPRRGLSPGSAGASIERTSTTTSEVKAPGSGATVSEAGGRVGRRGLSGAAAPAWGRIARAGRRLGWDRGAVVAVGVCLVGMVGLLAWRAWRPAVAVQEAGFAHGEFVDRWYFLKTPDRDEPTTARVAFVGVTWPIGFSADHLSRMDPTLHCDPAGRPMELEVLVPAGSVAAVVQRTRGGETTAVLPAMRSLERLYRPRP